MIKWKESYRWTEIGFDVSDNCQWQLVTPCDSEGTYSNGQDLASHQHWQLDNTKKPPDPPIMIIYKTSYRQTDRQLANPYFIRYNIRTIAVKVASIIKIEAIENQSIIADGSSSRGRSMIHRVIKSCQKKTYIISKKNVRKMQRVIWRKEEGAILSCRYNKQSNRNNQEKETRGVAAGFGGKV